ncbi:MAG: UDP-N-acetylmuramoyl-L-alanyl-D-glutamate--2,6-diaminopimelate ligase [Treponema sp.]|jgi:UDP-N-acetylmuramoyl-L-alanyl-D-glutamate--2,6-diaminopimelate ligase|nr:UDP-N-acetylmuramoyl-L-alanyl-D-glutamate--2,6-diaminopimelate ligase [Treponema sp.]
MERNLRDFFTPELAARSGCLETLVPPGGAENPRISGLEYDSRRVQPGSLYFALPGIHDDGRRYIPEAIRRGARAVVYQEALSGYPPGAVYLRVGDSRFAMSPVSDAFYGSPSRHLAVIGVTGTEGKSTTVYLVFQLLRLLGKKAGFISTVQFSGGGDAAWNPEHQTTPEATAIHRLLAMMRDQGAGYAVLESSSHGLSPRTNRLGDVAFDVGVMTNVTHEHLEFHGTWEQYRDDKVNLFRALDRYDRLKALGGGAPAFGVVNQDDPSAGYFAAATTRPCRSFSTKGAQAELSLQSIESKAGGNAYRVLEREPHRVINIEDHLPGAFNAGNVLAALLTVSGLLGAPIPELAPLVPRLEPVRGRMTAINKGQPFEVLVDYAHTPSSFNAIFPPLRQRLNAAGGRIISLFGSAGERDRTKRPDQGAIASKWSDIVILSDEDPRGEVPMAILEEIAAGVLRDNPGRKRGEDLFLIPGRPEAIRKALALARPGDLVLLLGKGHENSIIYQHETRPFDEIGEAETALAELGFS